MPNIFAKISLVGEAETRDVRAIFIYCKKMQTKEGSLAPSLRPGTGECLIQRQYDHGSGLRLSDLVHCSCIICLLKARGEVWLTEGIPLQIMLLT